MQISIVVPCYNEEEALPYFFQAAVPVMNGMEQKYHVSFEMIFVDDGSRDQTLKVMKDLKEKDQRIRYISFSRNFGKEAAMYAGMEKSNGDLVSIMDADLQDPPQLLEQMYRDITEEGYDCVATRRVSRKGEPVIRSLFARCFYRLINRISKADIVDGARDFRLMNRKFVDAVLSMCEYNRFSKGIFGWVGFETKWIEYENVKRSAGQTKWSFWKLFIYSLEGIIGFSTMPLALASVMGVLFCLLSFIIILFIIIRTLVWGDPVNGWPSLACIMFFIGGIQLFCIGILENYLAKTYLETKKRPIYIIKDTDIDLKRQEET